MILLKGLNIFIIKEFKGRTYEFYRDIKDA